MTHAQESNSGNLLAGWPQPPAPSDVIAQLTLEIEPVSKNRARVTPAEFTTIGATRVKTRGAHAYTPANTREFQEKVGWLLRQARVTANEVDDLGVHVVFHVRTYQRSDLDNFIKSLLDGCNGIAWRDDNQVTRLTSELVRGSEHPRIELVIFVAQHRARDCQKCGKPLTYQQISTSRVFCSKECYDTDQRRGTNRACVTCGTIVYRDAEKSRNANTYCSPECRAANRPPCRECGQPTGKPRSHGNFCSTECSVTWHRKRPSRAKKKRRKTPCADCGGPASPAAIRCFACLIAYRAVNGHSTSKAPQYDACPDCGGRKRSTAVRCRSCFRVAASNGTAGKWKTAAA